ncbi:MAG: hypothetical protein NTV51_25570 [Verrucomicrobia bacterium]|nr:hypothetical protein [Verrucomicrobiota bacterium]
MELSESTLTHLRDEAYAFLAQQALLAELAGLERERAAVATTRPRFGVLARKESRVAFEHSMRTVDDRELALRDRLTQLTGIAEWLYPIIRKDVSSYLAGLSPDYCRLLQISARLDDWDRAYRTVPELLVAFARDLRGLRQAAEGAAKSQESLAHELAVLRESAERLAQVEHELHIIEQAALLNAPAAITEQIRFPALPDLKRVSWVGRLAVIPPAKAVADVTRVEAEVRAFLGGPAEEIFPQLQAAREVCVALVNRMLDDYWNLLREHARTHYVEECGIDEVIAMLTERYVDTDIRQRQQSITISPFAWR